MPETRRIIRRPRAAEDYDAEQRKAAPQRYEADDEEDEDEEAEPDRNTVTKGWGGYRHTKAVAPTKFAKIYKAPDEGQELVMFLQDEPYASYMMHWCDWVPMGQKQGYVCIQEDCPLCEMGHQPSVQIRFNVLHCDPGAPSPKLYTYVCGITLAETLDKYNRDPKIGPLGGTYYSFSKTGGKRKRVLITPVKRRDLQDDWKFTPLTEDEIAKFQPKLADESDIDRDTRATLRQIADLAQK